MNNRPEVDAHLAAMRARLESAWAGRTAGADVFGYPADVQVMVAEVCALWNLRPPQRKGQKAYWITAARDLEEACGEFGVECLRQVRSEFEQHMAAREGLPPYTVEGPGSLVKAARSKAGQMRQSRVVSEHPHGRNIAR